MKPDTRECNISVVVPLYNEEQNLMPLFQRIDKSLSEYGKNFEIIFVNDGSTDGSERLLTEIQQKHHNVTVVNLFRRNGKAAALERGFEYVNGRYIVLMDSDLQYDPEDIPGLIMKMEKGIDVVSGKRVNRFDSKSVIITSWLFNKLMRWLTGLKFEDYFSGLKIFKKSVIDYLGIYGDLNRFAMVLACLEGFNVVEIPVNHHRRIGGVSKYNLITRFQRAFSDIIGVVYMITVNPDRLYYLGLGGYSLLSMGTTLLLIYCLAFYFERVAFANLFLIMGALICVIGIQILIFKRFGYDFFSRHQEEFVKRKRNVKNILRYNGTSR